MDYISNILEKLLSFLRLKKKQAEIASFIFLTIIFINGPWLTGSSYIKVDDSLRFTVPKNSNNINLTFVDNLFVGRYTIYIKKKNSQERLEVTDVKETKKNIQIDLSKYKNTYEKDPLYGDFSINIHFPETQNAKVSNFYVNGSEINLKDFFQKNLFVLKKYFVETESIREYISIFLLKYNDVISNYFLTFFTLFSFFLFIELLKLYFHNFKNDKSFEEYVLKKSLSNVDTCLIINHDVDKAECEIEMEYLRQDTRYRLFQVLGPAFGFLMTVSSLIAALHPSLQKSQNISIFFGAMQVAMVSTFIGLAIRIIAMLLQRINNKIFDRTDAVFTKIKNRQSETC